MASRKRTLLKVIILGDSGQALTGLYMQEMDNNTTAGTHRASCIRPACLLTYLADSCCFVQSWQDLPHEPVRKQEVLESVQSYHWSRLLDEGSPGRRQTSDNAGQPFLLNAMPFCMCPHSPWFTTYPLIQSRGWCLVPLTINRGTIELGLSESIFFGEQKSVDRLCNRWQSPFPLKMEEQRQMETLL